MPPGHLVTLDSTTGPHRDMQSGHFVTLDSTTGPHMPLCDQAALHSPQACPPHNLVRACPPHNLVQACPPHNSVRASPQHCQQDDHKANMSSSVPISSYLNCCTCCALAPAHSKSLCLPLPPLLHQLRALTTVHSQRCTHNPALATVQQQLHQLRALTTAYSTAPGPQGPNLQRPRHLGTQRLRALAHMRRQHRQRLGSQVLRAQQQITQHLLPRLLAHARRLA